MANGIEEKKTDQHQSAPSSLSHTTRESKYMAWGKVQIRVEVAAQRVDSAEPERDPGLCVQPTYRGVIANGHNMRLQAPVGMCHGCSRPISMRQLTTGEP